MFDNDILKELDNSFSGEAKESNTIKFKYEIIQNYHRRSRLLSSVIFLGKYIATSSLIFVVLLLCTNYSAYYNIAKSHLLKEQVEQRKKGLIESVEAANISTNFTEEVELEEDKKLDKLSIKKYKNELDSNDIKLDIDITTLDNRVIIPKIGKNIPLVDIQNRNISGHTELNDIFMQELENGIIRYPGSARPGELGLSFIFGHSSNFPWLKGDYNDVFATLDRVMIGDEVIIYYNQQKYTFKIKERAIIKPGDVGILKRNNNKAEVAIMTCWPIGTTLNRFIIVGELVN